MAKLKIQSFAKLPNEYVSVERSRGLSLLEEKLAYMLINSMQKRWEGTKKLEQIDYNFIAHASITIDDFINTMQIGSANRKEIGHALQNLVLFALAIKTSTNDRFITMFSEFVADYETNKIEYKFNDSFVTYFTGICKDFFRLSINEVIGLNSTHAIRIYQLLKTKQNMDKNKFEFTIEELKQLLNIEKKYKLYGHLKIAVLEVAKEQINSSEASEFHIAYTEIKTFNAVTSIEFEILK
jgi:plasmid replication initiation protein